MTSSPSALTSISILYNDSYGDFCFSPAFNAEYMARTGKPTHVTERILRLVGPESIRMDAVAIALWYEKGSEWCSGPGAALELRTLPAIFERYWTIDEYSGSETVHVNIDEVYADALHDYMRTGDNGLLVDRYRMIRAAATGLKAGAETPINVIQHVTDGYGSYTGV
jgi:hypothetical protein